MNILIIEDEPMAGRQLMDMAKRCRPLFRFCPIIDTVESAISYIQEGHAIDLIFLDIHLADGDAFDLLAKIDLPCPVIFTTAYEEYAIKAFEVNGVDYLLKPIAPERLNKAIIQFEKHYANRTDAAANDAYTLRSHHLWQEPGMYKQSFLIPYKDKLLPVPVKDFAWFEINSSVVSGTKSDGTVHILEDRSLDLLARHIDPRQFYRANRQFLINREAIQEIFHYFNGKLLVRITPQPKDKIVISRDKVAQFKLWVTS